MKKHLGFLLVAAIALMMNACVKDGDFDALKHDITIEGEFDPILGFPIAKMSANIAQLIGMLDTTSNMAIYVDDDDLVSVRYLDTFSTDLDLSKELKYGRKAATDSIFFKETLNGVVEINLFQQLQQMTDMPLSAKGLFVNLDAFLKTKVNDPVQAMIDRGVKVYCNNIVLKLTCLDGASIDVPILDSTDKISLLELNQGKLLNILNQYDLSNLANRKPTGVFYSVQINADMPFEVYAALGSGSNLRDSLGIDSLHVELMPYVDFPMQIYCGEMMYEDTIDVDLAELEQQLDKIKEQITLQDSGSYLVLEAENELPLNFAINASLLKSNGFRVVSQLFSQDTLLSGAPIKHLSGSDSYVSNGSRKSRIVMPVTRNLYENLGKTRKIALSLRFSTSTEGADTSNPTIVVQGKDRLKLRAYLVVAPHIHLSL